MAPSSQMLSSRREPVPGLTFCSLITSQNGGRVAPCPLPLAGRQSAFLGLQCATGINKAVLCSQAILVHQLSRQLTQNPFRKNKGRVVRVEFHPAKPFFFVATQNHVRVYNLAKQQLTKKLVAGSGIITALAVHHSGDHLIVGTEVSLLLPHMVVNLGRVCLWQ